MKKLYELLNLRNKQDGDFGVEIECEGRNLAIPPEDFWRIENDGSLRGQFPHNSAEWIFRKPLKLDKAVKVIDDLRAFQDAAKAELDFSFRTSVHVHMNVQQLTFEQYLNTVYTYLLLENVLVRYCGNDRIGNRFCLRTQDAEGLTERLQELFKGGFGHLRLFTADHVKYASINLAATLSYGSLEFRAMQGNLEPKYIGTWLKALYNLREFAMKQKDPRAIHDMFVRSNPSEFMQQVLKEVYPFFSYEDEVNEMRQAFSITLDLPYAYTDEQARQKALQDHIKEQEELIRARHDRDQEILRVRMEDAINRVRMNNPGMEVQMDRAYNLNRGLIAAIHD